MSASDIISLMPWIIIILIFGFGIVAQSRSEKESEKQNAENKVFAELKKNKEAEVEMALIKRATLSLPDSRAVIDLLKTRYGWVEIVETIGLNRLHLRVLRGINAPSELSLPNMKLKHYGSDEARVLKRAKEIANPLDYEYGLESLFQEPTTDTLLELHARGFVIANALEDKDGKKYKVCISEMGAKLKKLDSEFSDRNDGLPSIRRVPSSNEARKAISHLVYLSI